MCSLKINGNVVLLKDIHRKKTKQQKTKKNKQTNKNPQNNPKNMVNSVLSNSLINKTKQEAQR